MTHEAGLTCGLYDLLSVAKPEFGWPRETPVCRMLFGPL